MEDTHYSNEYLTDDHIVNNVNKDCNAVFVEFTVINQRSYGCIYTSKKKNCFHCKSCRKLYDKRRYDIKKKRLLDSSTSSTSNSNTVPEQEESLNEGDTSKEAPSAFRFGTVGIEWYKRTHLPECTLISSYNLFLGNFENLVVIHRSKFPGSSSSFHFKTEPNMEEESYQEWKERNDMVSPKLEIQETEGGQDVDNFSGMDSFCKVEVDLSYDN